MLGLPRKLQSAVELACVTTLIYRRHNGYKRHDLPDPHPLSRPGGPDAPSRPDRCEGPSDRCEGPSGWGGGALPELDRVGDRLR